VTEIAGRPIEPLHFYLGTHMPAWLWSPAAGFPLFVSHRRLAAIRTLHRATRGWALDSGGFTELSAYGEWRTSPEQYAEAVARYDAQIGQLEWAAPQDWMCERWILEKTGLSVDEHQARTVENYLTLTSLWPQFSDEDDPFMPVLQGWTLADYQRCADRYAAAGIRLDEYPVVGIGSVCRRQSTGEIGAIVSAFTPWLALHGFGVKTGGLGAYGHLLTSADSMAWSFDGRRSAPLPGHTHKNCANCLDFARIWRARLLAGLDGTHQHQESLPLVWGATA
jgi:hypothetical protein